MLRLWLLLPGPRANRSNQIVRIDQHRVHELLFARTRMRLLHCQSRVIAWRRVQMRLRLRQTAARCPRHTRKIRVG